MLYLLIVCSIRLCAKRCLPVTFGCTVLFLNAQEEEKEANNYHCTHVLLYEREGKGAGEGVVDILNHFIC